MKILSFILVTIGLLAILSILIYLKRWITPTRNTEMDLMEPDLKIVDKPEMIAKIPENETATPGVSVPSSRIK